MKPFLKIKHMTCTISLVRNRKLPREEEILGTFSLILVKWSTAGCIAILTRRLWKCLLFICRWIWSLRAAQMRAQEKHLLTLAQKQQEEPDSKQGSGTPGVSKDHSQRQCHLSQGFPHHTVLWACCWHSVPWACWSQWIEPFSSSLYTQWFPKWGR